MICKHVSSLRRTMTLRSMQFQIPPRPTQPLCYSGYASGGKWMWIVSCCLTGSFGTWPFLKHRVLAGGAFGRSCICDRWWKRTHCRTLRLRLSQWCYPTHNVCMYVCMYICILSTYIVTVIVCVYPWIQHAPGVAHH